MLIDTSYSVVFIIILSVVHKSSQTIKDATTWEIPYLEEQTKGTYFSIQIFQESKSWKWTLKSQKTKPFAGIALHLITTFSFYFINPPLLKCQQFSFLIIHIYFFYRILLSSLIPLMRNNPLIIFLDASNDRYRFYVQTRLTSLFSCKHFVISK